MHDSVFKLAIASYVSVGIPKVGPVWSSNLAGYRFELQRASMCRDGAAARLSNLDSWRTCENLRELHKSLAAPVSND
jgi:hypothetical protein